MKGSVKKIRDGMKILREHEIIPEIFFAPAHTFDENTLRALKKESEIRVISDTIASDVYYEDGFYFIPQQSGRCRRLPFKVVTFCYHPNIMNNEDFNRLELFLEKYSGNFDIFHYKILRERRLGIIDRVIRSLYFIGRK